MYASSSRMSGMSAEEETEQGEVGGRVGGTPC